LGEDLINKGLESLVITAGGHGSYYFEKDFKMMRKPREVMIESASGAGDAFMAGYAYGLYNDLEIEERMASAEAAARITLMSAESCSKDMNENNLKGEIYD
ncbi:MAG: PfkB family carbohydrate kinase, partial [Peptoniphilus harei]|nr:PfkB family carbohydrate kinase [Peptoniphilus harei]